MGKVANDPGQDGEELTTGGPGGPGDGAAAGNGAARPMSVARMLTLPAFSGAEVLAGASGLDRVVRRANVMEVPDVTPRVRAEGLLLTTGYPLREAGGALADLVAALDQHGVSAVAVKLHQYLDRLPEDMLAEADARGLPLILVPDDVGFDDVLTQVFTNVVSERASLLELGEDVHRQLVEVVLSGGGVADLASAISDLFSAVTLVTTADGRVLSEVGGAEQRAVLRESSVFHPSGRFRTEVATSGVHVVEDLPGSHAVVPIRGGRIDHGRLVLFHADRVLTASDLAVLERAATVAAISLTKEIAITAVESKYRGDFLRDVLAGRAGTAEEVLGHGATLGWDMSRPTAVVIAALDTEQAPPMSRGYQGPLELERFSAAWQSVVTRRDPSIPVVGFAAEVVALLPVVEAAVRGVAGDGGGGRRPFATGVSRVAPSPDDLPVAYEQARKALTVGRQMHGRRAVAHFDDLGVFRLLSLIDDDRELTSFVRETLSDLAGETHEAADLRETLQVLLDTNLNVAETARRLHFHYNTLRYRISKIERMVGPFTTDPNLRLDLALALRIVSMRAI